MWNSVTKNMILSKQLIARSGFELSRITANNEFATSSLSTFLLPCLFTLSSLTFTVTEHKSNNFLVQMKNRGGDLLLMYINASSGGN